MKPVKVPPRVLAPGQRCQVTVHDTATDEQTVVFDSTEILLEAPQWMSDGVSLMLNGGGRMWRLNTLERDLRPLPFDGVPPVNNDHVLSPDRATVYLSANDGHIYSAPADGGVVARVTQDSTPPRFHFLHGVRPDGTTLLYVGVEGDLFGDRTARIRSLNLTTGIDIPLSNDTHLADGCEYSADGNHIYFNTTAFGTGTHDMGIARMRADGSHLEAVTEDERVDWFPHESPDGSRLAYLSYPKGTEGHPADLPVEIRLLMRDGKQRTIASFTGGQGTINVNSWSPDSRYLAYVAYPLEDSNDR